MWDASVYSSPSFCFMAHSETDNSVGMCIVWSLELSCHSRKQQMREMLRCSKSVYSRIDLSACVQGRIKTSCNTILDSSHHQVKVPSCPRCRICEVRELSQACVCVCYMYIYTHMHVYTHTHTHTHIFYKVSHPKVVVHRLSLRGHIS